MAEAVEVGAVGVAGAVMSRAVLEPELHLVWSSLRTADLEEAGIELDGEFPVVVPYFMRQIIEQISIVARQSKYVDHESGVSARLGIANYRAILRDLNPPEFKAVIDRLVELYTYMYCPEATAYPWGSRTAQQAGAGRYGWKGEPGKPFGGRQDAGHEQ